jgi:hypothetical protein
MPHNAEAKLRLTLQKLRYVSVGIAIQKQRRVHKQQGNVVRVK